MIPTDLLLLNTSNYPRVPLYPYAFIQVAEVARRHGLRVASVDLLGVPEGEWRPRLRALIAAHQPRAVGVHLRQLDSLFVEEYRGYWSRDLATTPSALPGAARAEQEVGFRPVEATARLVALIRDLTRAPVLLGGHGFTSSPRAVFRRVAPDLAVVGEPDGLFARFDDALAGRDRASIPNLAFAGEAGLVLTPRVNFGPAEGPEYTPALVDEIRRFYGSQSLPQQTFSVEVMRGCPYRCSFCCEPGVKGREARVRSLDAVEADVTLLARQGLGRIWMVCSELNVFGPELALALGERLIRLRERLGVDLRWYAFSLPSRMSTDTWRTLSRSGFRGGFNTFLSLDDENLRAARVPYRAADALAEYENLEIVSRELPPGDGIRARGTMSLFLGNTHATTATVSRSLAALHARGLLETIRLPGVMTATRVFETLEEGAAAGEVVSFGPTPDGEVDLSLPTFAYPAALLRHFGGRRPLERFMRWLDLTLLSRAFEATLDWSLFLAGAAAEPALRAWLDDAALRDRWGGHPALGPVLEGLHRGALRALLLPAAEERGEAGAAAHAALTAIFTRHPDPVAAALAALGLPPALDEALALPVLDLLGRLYARFDDAEAALAAVAAAAPGDAALAVLAARYVIHRRNVILDPAFREPLLGGAARSPHDLKRGASPHPIRGVAASRRSLPIV